MRIEEMPIVQGRCSECGAEGQVHDFFGDETCAACREKDEKSLAPPEPA